MVGKEKPLKFETHAIQLYDIVCIMNIQGD
jgi:hypothetical protein